MYPASQIIQEVKENTPPSNVLVFQTNKKTVQKKATILASPRHVDLKWRHIPAPINNLSKEQTEINKNDRRMIVEDCQDKK